MTLFGILLILGFLAPSSWALVSLIRRLRRNRASLRWWVTFVTLAAFGAVAGMWFAFHFEYQLGTRTRLGSFPIPIVFFRLEHGHSVDYPVPELQAWASIFTNVVTVTALASLPVLVASWRKHKEERSAV